MPSCVTAAGRAACACRSQLASLLACQMPLKFGLPPTVAGRVSGACPDVCVIEAEMIAPTDAAAMATVSMESAKRSRMRASLFFISSFLCALFKPRSLLLERVLFNAYEIRSVVLGGRVRTAALGISELFHSRSQHQRWMTIIAFDTARLVIDAVLLLALPGVLKLGRPGLCPHGRIVNGDDIFKRVGAGARPALDEMQILARPQHVGLGAEIGDVDDERIALEAAARVAIPLTDTGRQMRPPVHHDVALPALTLPDVVKHRDAARRLHDAAEAAAIGGAKFGQPEGEAAIRQRAIFRTVMAIDAPGIVARRRLISQ